jgi:hypothetical protein
MKDNGGQSEKDLCRGRFLFFYMLYDACGY